MSRPNIVRCLALKETSLQGRVEQPFLDRAIAAAHADDAHVLEQEPVADGTVRQVDRSIVYCWVQRFLPLFGAAARAHRRSVGTKWRVDETYVRLNGRWTYVYRAIDEDGQVVDAYFSERRNAAAAEAFFRRAIAETGVKPQRVTTDKAKCYPPALRAVLPTVEHQTSKYLNNGIERDHGHLKHRLYPMRGFKQTASASIIVRGHALVRNLRNGFSALTLHVPLNLRLAVAWPQLARAI